ncbi:MAG TPA: ABC transporter ATP-binding protein [Candidatus Eisenbacteria bacterium]|nr:ABC transporter ATP-binding protein [Candidatus Eisenbacteria bacterium]
MALLELRGVSKRFGGLQALHKVDLTVEEGTIASLIGPNGAGKTTLFHVLTGIYRPDSGDVRFGGRTTVGLKPEEITKLGISRTFQNIRLFSHMTVLDNVLVGMHCRLPSRLGGILLASERHRVQEASAVRRAIELIELTGLSGREYEWAQHLSYGDQRRLEIARALAAEPKLLLLDEPTAGMNLTEARQLMGLFMRLLETHVRAILLIEHNMRVVMGVSHRVHVLDYGEKIAEGVPEEVRRNPRVIEAYLGRSDWAEDVKR